MGEILNLTGMRYNDRMKLADDYILQLCLFVGIDPVPEIEIRAMIIDFISENYPLFSLEEVKNAFTMALADKLEIDEKNRQHYNKLTAIWVTTILNAYRRHLEKHMLEYRRQEQRLISAQTNDISEAQSDKIMVEGVLRVYNEYRTNGLFTDLAGSCYNWLLRKELLTAPTDEKYTAMLYHAKTQVKADMMSRKFHGNDVLRKAIEMDLENLETEYANNSRVVLLVKNRLLSEFFAILQDETELKTLLSKYYEG